MAPEPASIRLQTASCVRMRSEGFRTGADAKEAERD